MHVLHNADALLQPKERLCKIASVSSTNAITIIILFIVVVVVDFRLTRVGFTTVYRNSCAFCAQ